MFFLSAIREIPLAVDVPDQEQVRSGSSFYWLPSGKLKTQTVPVSLLSSQAAVAQGTRLQFVFASPARHAPAASASVGSPVWGLVYPALVASASNAPRIGAH